MPVIKKLKHDVENVWMSFFDLIKKHNLIGTPSDSFGQGTALIITNIARRRAQQTRDGMFFHIFRHIKTKHGFIIIKQKSCQCFGQLCFAYTCRPQHQKTAKGLVRVVQAGTGPADRIGNG